MLTNLKTITLLMLLAGVSLGVFASTLIAAGNPEPEPAQFDERVEAYRDAYGLTDKQADAVRTELERHRQKMFDLLLELRRRHEGEFRNLTDETEQRIKAIIQPDGAEDGNPGDSNR